MSMPPPIPNLRGALDLSSLVNRPAGATPGSPGLSGGVAAGGSAGGSTTPAGQPRASVPVPALILDGTDANFTAILDLSAQVPIIVELSGAGQPTLTDATALLERLIVERAGKIVFVRVDAEANPQLVQAFTATSIPTVAAVIAGRPLQIFSGAIGEQELRDVLDQILTVAAQNGVTGIAIPADGGVAPELDADGNPVPPPMPALPPLHQEAYDAVERGDYTAAIEAYNTALKQNPNDDMARAGLAQVSLLNRLQGKTIAAVRGAASADPTNLEAQLDVVDLDISGGHIDDAFDRLLTLFPSLDPDGKNAVRTRLLELFDVVGLDDPRVGKARSRLTNLLF
jgi:putative thioredoxin